VTINPVPLIVAGGLTFAVILSCGATAYADYVPGMTCHEVRGFAQVVAEQKLLGETLKDQIIGVRQSLGSEYRDTKHALETIVRAIYGIKSLSGAAPEAVGDAYERACKLME
jgi:hypothetical protein